MKIFFSISGKEAASRLNTLKGKPVLESFYNPLPAKWATKKRAGFFESVFLDSGAFSAWQQGQAIDFNQYIDFALESDEKNALWLVAGDLSVNDDPEKSIEVSEELKGLGLPVIPCFHQGENLHFLDYYQDRFGIVALGTKEKTNNKDEVFTWLCDCFDRLSVASKDENGRLKTYIHGYRLGQYINRFPFDSVDSTSWSNSGDKRNKAISFSYLNNFMPWLTDDEVGDLIWKFYDRKDTCQTYVPHQEDIGDHLYRPSIGTKTIFSNTQTKNKLLSIYPGKRDCAQG